MHGCHATRTQLSARRGASYVVRVHVSPCPLNVLQSGVALIAAAATHVLTLVWKALHHPVRDNFVRDGLPIPHAKNRIERTSRT